MTHDQATAIIGAHLLPAISARYGLEDCQIELVPGHDGGRNAVYRCDRAGAGGPIMRIAFLGDRRYEDLLAEVEYVRYLRRHGGPVADVIASRSGNLVETIGHGGRTFFVCLFERARGRQLAENGYRYREGAPLSEYFYNCGAALGKLHRLSKEYRPVHRRYDFFDKYNVRYVNALIPDSLPLLKDKLAALIGEMGRLDKDAETYGLVHFDFSDGNYMIDYDTGAITAFDFDNACYCWYLYDLANLWAHGVGWVQFEPDAGVRRRFMDEYFAQVLAGYRSQTQIDEAALCQLPLMIRATQMEGVVDAFEVMRNNGQAPECDEELAYTIRCLEQGIAYNGFFDESYSHRSPFQAEARAL